MKPRLRVLKLMLAGLVIAGAAYAVRVRLFRTTLAQTVALSDPRVVALKSQVLNLQQQVDRDPNNVPLRWQLADQYQKLGLIPYALDQLLAIQKLQPNSRDAAMAVANTYLALQKPFQCEAAYKLVTKKWPKYYPGWEGLAAFYFHERSYDNAFVAIGMAIKVEPNRHELHYILGVSLLQYVEQFPNPEEYMMQVRAARRQLAPLVPIWQNQGEVYLPLARIDEILQANPLSLKEYAQAVKYIPNSVDGILGLARLYVRVGDRPSAIRAINEALARHVNSGSLHDMLGQQIETQGGTEAYQKAYSEFKTATSMQPTNAFFWERLGNACIRLNRMEEARSAFEQAVSLNPNRAAAFQQLAAINNRTGDMKRANEAAKEAQGILFNDNQMRQLQILSQVHPDNANLKMALADRYRELGNAAAARDKYNQVLALEPDNAKAAAALKELKGAMERQLDPSH